MSKYGEPWHAYADGEFVSGDGSWRGTLDVPDAIRVVACVNALVGIEHPAAIPELIAAAEAVTQWAGPTPDADGMARLRAALTSLGRTKPT